MCTQYVDLVSNGGVGLVCVQLRSMLVKDPVVLDSSQEVIFEYGLKDHQGCENMELCFSYSMTTSGWIGIAGIRRKI